jgi:hypothetical protein
VAGSRSRAGDRHGCAGGEGSRSRAGAGVRCDRGREFVATGGGSSLRPAAGVALHQARVGGDTQDPGMDLGSRAGGVHE